MIKKLKYILDNFDKLKELLEKEEAPKKQKKKKVSIEGVPEEQKKYIEENYKLS